MREQIKKSESVIEGLIEKAKMEWYRRMVFIHEWVEEIVLNELIYA
ncbi:MAG: TnpV protein [Clostridiales bacterium]|nr:TnpV protein [Clostridiales bacterium]